MSDSRKTHTRPAFSRRQALKAGLAAGAVVSAPAFVRSGWAQSKRLIIANSGGSMGDAKRKALYEPFTKKTGIEITTVAGADLAKLKLQVEQGAVEWDVVDVESFPGRRGLRTRVNDTLELAVSDSAVIGDQNSSGRGRLPSRPRRSYPRP